MRKFKLAYSSIREETPNLEKLLTTLKENGWEGWEIRQPLDWLGSAKRVREIWQRVGLPVAAVTCRGLSLDNDYAMVERNKRRIEFAAEVGADCYMLVGASRVPERSAAEDEIKALAELGEKLATYAQALGIEVCYHIHTNTTLDSIEEWRRFMELIDRCKLCIDVSHSALWGWDPCEAIRAYQDRLVYVHLQDWNTYRYLELGEGDLDLLDFPRIMQTLEQIGFQRWVTTVPGISERSAEEKIRVNREYLRKLGF